MKFNFKKFSGFPLFGFAVGGLEIGDDAVRFAGFSGDGSVARHASVPLPSGAVSGGMVADGDALAAALYRLHGMLGPVRREIPAVVSISSSPVYAQIFSLPYLPDGALEDAARLNLRMVSPIGIDGAYADWQRAGASADAETGSTIEVLGAFAEMPVVDAYRLALKRAGFFAVALEPSSLSLARVVARAPGLDSGLPAVAISAAGDGAVFVILKNGNPYFTRFIPWGEFARSPEDSRGVPLDRFKEVVGQELHRLLDFYRGRWGGAIGTAIVMNVPAGREVAGWIKKEFSLDVFVLGGYQSLGQEWLVAAGAALRGLVPRSDDRLISLGPVGTEEQFVRGRVRRFVGFWRTAAFVVMGAVLLAYFGADLFLARLEAQVASELARIPATASGAEAAAIAARADEFGSLAAKALVAARAARPAAPGLRAIVSSAGKSITLGSVRLAGEKSFAVSGTAPSEQAAVAFKALLSDNPAIGRVDMPLSAIVPIAGGRASFSATVILK